MLRDLIPVPLLYPAAALVTELGDRVRRVTSGEWTETEIYQAMTDALATWASRVKVPFYEELSVDAELGEVGLPYYLRNVRVQDWQSVYANGQYVDFGSKRGASERTLSLPSYSTATTVSVSWLVEASPLLTSDTLTLAVGISDTAISLTINPAPLLVDCGFLRIGAEWLSYQGLLYVDENTVTLLGLERGLRGSLNTEHSLGATVEQCIPITSMGLIAQLTYAVAARLHLLPLSRASVEEREQHLTISRLMLQLADEAWSTFTPLTSPLAPIKVQSI